MLTISFHSLSADADLSLGHIDLGPSQSKNFVGAKGGEDRELQRELDFELARRLQDAADDRVDLPIVCGCMVLTAAGLRNGGQGDLDLLPDDRVVAWRQIAR